jgi:outer membrane lipoprotein-sorting protein
MNRLRTASARRLTVFLGAAIVLVLSATIAQAALTGSGPTPSPKALANAVLDAFNAPEPDGLTATIHFTNRLLPSGSLPGGAASPLASGADGRLWIQKSGRFRLELQSDAGDAQIVSDGDRVTVYDASSNTVYRATLPSDTQDAVAPADEHHAGEKLTLAKIQRTLDRLAQTWTVSAADPTSTAGQPTYTVKISPKDDGGLLGAAQVAWDSVRGAPLRAAVYAQGQSEPVLELAATDVSYDAVPDSAIDVAPPKDAKVDDLTAKDTSGSGPGAGAYGPHDGTGAPAAEHGTPQSLASVQRALSFTVAAPDTLAGLPRKGVRLVTLDGERGALAIYGKGLGAIAVLQHKAGAAKATDAASSKGDRSLRLPAINIDGATGSELATALGTVVTFERGGVAYVVAGSVPPVAAENAARDLR